ncbi:MAG: ribonuclease HII [Christensenellales bacterium]
MKDKINMLEYENRWLNLGAKFIAGMDEVGRGPLAGPVVCASVIMPLDNIIDGVNDSKKLSEKKRITLDKKIRELALSFSIVEIDPKTIDKINILNATKMGMVKAVNGLSVKPDVVLIDAVSLSDLAPTIKQESIIKGDMKSYSIACASIIAKVYRDNLMTQIADKYPEYNFAKHKGYGTKEHIEAIKKYGPCELHRKTFIKHFVKEEYNG